MKLGAAGDATLGGEVEEGGAKVEAAEEEQKLARDRWRATRNADWALQVSPRCVMSRRGGKRQSRNGILPGPRYCTVRSRPTSSIRIRVGSQGKDKSGI